jgi:hypothetical protein
MTYSTITSHRCDTDDPADKYVWWHVLRLLYCYVTCRYPLRMYCLMTYCYVTHSLRDVPLSSCTLISL